MKKVSLFLVLVFFMSSVFSFYKCYSETITAVIYVKVKAGQGSRTWNEKKEYCPKEGNNCIKNRKEIPIQSTLIPNENGYSISFIMPSTDYDVTLEGQEPFTVTKSGENFTCDYADEIEIIQCDSHPELIGRKVDLDGITSGPNGEMTVLLPVTP